MFNIHLFVCTNQKKDKKNCFDDGGEDFRVQLKERLKEYGKSIRVNKAGCLGLCSKGPAIVIYPEAKWFLGADTETLNEIEKYISERINDN